MTRNDVLSNAECPTRGKELSKYERNAAKKWKMKMSHKNVDSIIYMGSSKPLTYHASGIVYVLLIPFYSVTTEVIRVKYGCKSQETGWLTARNKIQSRLQTQFSISMFNCTVQKKSNRKQSKNAHVL